MLQQPSGIPDTSGYHVRHGCHGVAVARAASCVDPRLRRPVVAVEPVVAAKGAGLGLLALVTG
jgi:hypothetical protein